MNTFWGAGSHLSSKEGFNSVSPPQGLTSTEHRPVFCIPPGKILLQSLGFASTGPWARLAVPEPLWTFLLRRRRRWEAGALLGVCTAGGDSAVCSPGFIPAGVGKAPSGPSFQGDCV